MIEIEEKYKRFTLDENMKEMFSHSSVDIAGMGQNRPTFIITTVVIDKTGRISELKDNKNA